MVAAELERLQGTRKRVRDAMKRMTVLEGQIQFINHLQQFKYATRKTPPLPVEAKLWYGPLHWTQTQGAVAARCAVNPTLNVLRCPPPTDDRHPRRARYDLIAAKVAEVVRSDSVTKNAYWEMLKGLLDLSPRASRAHSPITPEEVRLQALELHLPMGLAAQNHMLWLAVAHLRAPPPGSWQQISEMQYLNTVCPAPRTR